MKAYLEKHLDQIRTDLALDALCLFSRNIEDQKLEILFWSGDKPRDTCPFGVTPLGQLGLDGTPFSLSKTHSRPKYQSEIGVPIHDAHNNFVAVLSAASLERNFFSDKKNAQLKAVCNLLESKWLE